jgi:hypothetical protein
MQLGALTRLPDVLRLPVRTAGFFFLRDIANINILRKTAKAVK